MYKSRIFKNKVIIFLLLLFGIAGGAFFLPLNLDGQYTCLYHRLISYEYPVHNPDIDIADQEIEQQQKRGIEHDMHGHGEKMLNMYIIHYTFFWWGSLGLAAFCIYQLRSLHKYGKQKLS